MCLVGGRPHVGHATATAAAAAATATTGSGGGRRAASLPSHEPREGVRRLLLLAGGKHILFVGPQRVGGGGANTHTHTHTRTHPDTHTHTHTHTVEQAMKNIRRLTSWHSWTETTAPLSLGQA